MAACSAIRRMVTFLRSARDCSCEVRSTSTGRPTRISWQVGSSGAPHRRLPRIRAPCGDRGPRRESARTARIGERRHFAPAQRTAERHGAVMARARRPLRSSFQRSAISFQLGFARA